MKSKITIIIIGAFFILFTGCQKEKTYCGVISEKYILHKNNGGVYNVVFYSDSLKKYVNVSVTGDCYVNSVVGKRICFDLYEHQVK